MIIDDAELLRRVTADELCGAIALALEANDIAAVPGLLRRLALKDPTMAEFLLDVFTGKVDAETLGAIIGEEL